MGEIRNITVTSISQPDGNGHRRVTSDTGDVLDRVDVGNESISRGNVISVEATAMQDTDHKVYQVWQVRSVTRA